MWRTRGHCLDHAWPMAHLRQHEVSQARRGEAQEGEEIFREEEHYEEERRKEERQEDHQEEKIDRQKGGFEVMTPQNTSAALARGLFLTFEGGDGTGKSTQASLLASRLEASGYDVCRVHEPGGTVLGEKIRELLLGREQEGMAPLAELLLYEAARAQVMADVIRPAVDAGKVVICDRFTDSTVAYQGYGRELGADLVDRLNALVTEGFEPDRTIMLTLDPHLARERVLGRNADGQPDRMESAGSSFNERMLTGFERIAESKPGRIRTVDAQGDIETVYARVVEQLADLFSAAGISLEGETR